MIKLKCNHCKHEWIYKGKRKYYTSCPECHYMVNIKKAKEINKVNKINQISTDNKIKKDSSVNNNSNDNI